MLWNSTVSFKESLGLCSLLCCESTRVHSQILPRQPAVLIKTWVLRTKEKVLLPGPGTDHREVERKFTGMSHHHAV